MNEYKRVTNGKIGSTIAYHGKSFEGVSWGNKATVDDYAAADLYQLIYEPPDYNEKTERPTGEVVEVVDEDKKQIRIVQIIEPIPADEIKEMEREKLRLQYEAEKKAGCPTSFGFKIDCTHEDLNNFANSKKLLDELIEDNPELKATGTIVVRDYDKQDHTMSYTDFRTMVIELGIHAMTLREKYWEATNAIK